MIIAVYPDKSENSSNPNQRNKSSSPGKNLNSRTIAGITIGAILGAAATIATVAYFYRHLRRRRALATASQATHHSEQTTVEQSTQEFPKAELAGDSAIWGDRPRRSRIFLDRQEVLPITATTPPALGLEGNNDGRAPSGSEVAGGDHGHGSVTVPRQQAAELDAVNREIRELPAAGIEQKIEPG